MTGYSDLANLSEDERINVIGKYVTDQKKIVGVVLEDDKKKIDRYVTKLLTRWPELIIMAKTPLWGGTVLVKVGPKPPVTSSPAAALR